MRFRATVALSGKTATGIVVPDSVVAGLGSSRRPAVHATVNGYTFRSTVARMGGAFMLPVSAEVRAHAGVAAGDEVEVALRLDTEPRTVAVPPDLAAALDAEPGATSLRQPLLQPPVARCPRRRGRQDPGHRQRRIASTLTALRSERATHDKHT